MIHDNNANQVTSCHVSIVVLGVSYQSNSEALCFLRQFAGGKAGQRPFLILIDNGDAPDLSCALSDAECTQRDLIVHVPGSNLGYFGGAASALDAFLLTHPLPDWVIVCNVDLFVQDENFFSRLISYSQSHTHSVVAPGVISGLSGKDQNPFMRVRPHRLRMKFYKILFQWYPAHLIYSVMYLIKEKLYKLSHGSEVGMPEPPGTGEPLPIYAGHGAFLAFRKSYFEAGGSLRHGVFLFGEEIFVAETVKRLGLTIGYDPRLRVFHRGHTTTGYIPSQQIAIHMREAARYCADTWFSG